MSDQSGLIDGVQFDKDDAATRLFVAANYWREKADELKAKLLAAEAHALAMEKDAKRWKEKARLQRRELRRLNKVLGPYWAGFRKGLGMEAEGKLRLTMIQAFGSEKVRAAEHAAIDASRARA